MDLKKIENKILSLSPFVKEIVVVIYDNHPFAVMHPDFKALKSAKIINIQEELRWYAVELYNMKVDEDEKVRGYLISKEELPKTDSGEIDLSAINELIKNKKVYTKEESHEPDDELYEAIKEHLKNYTDSHVSISSHLELDLGLDSLDYVELFTFLEESFDVHVDEVIFSNIMKLEDLYEYVKKHHKKFEPTQVEWKDILNKNANHQLIYSPYIMYAYKTLLLPLFKLYFRLEIRAKENIPATTCIFAPSHQSMLDGFILEASLPYKILKRTFFLAFKQVFGTWLLEPVSRNGQSILIDANINLKNSMQLVAQPLKEGSNVVVFPEGARTRDRELLEFRPFFAMLSKEYNVPVVPVVIDGGFEALRTGTIIPKPKKIKLTFLEPIYPDDLSIDEIMHLTREAIANEMKRNPVLI
ncbi:MAG: 1-acyl-sn-glycerol-3-phosphate acyltransferase [Sulfurimonas sp.]|nr:1-acyl-sn-glycerol-3-phosphate acyltransferase [Sulfurimonas sp.]